MKHYSQFRYSIINNHSSLKDSAANRSHSRETAYTMLHLSVSIGSGVVRHEGELNSTTKQFCVVFSASDNDYVEGDRVSTIRVESGDRAINTSSLQATVTIHDNDSMEILP